MLVCKFRLCLFVCNTESCQLMVCTLHHHLSVTNLVVRYHSTRLPMSLLLTMKYDLWLFGHCVHSHVLKYCLFAISISLIV